MSRLKKLRKELRIRKKEVAKLEKHQATLKERKEEVKISNRFKR